MVLRLVGQQPYIAGGFGDDVGNPENSRYSRASESDNRVNSISAIEPRPGYRISSIIRGHSTLAEARRGMDSTAMLADLTAFVDVGITTIDCDTGDPGFERLVGSLLQDLQQTRGSDVMQSLRIHTKFVPDLSSPGAFNESQVESAIDQAIARLGVDALDLVQLHWPIPDTSACLDALGYLTMMQAKGKINHLGVTNFDADHLGMLIQSGFDIITAQVQFSLIDQRPRGDFADLCRQHNIALLASGTLAGGFLSQRWLGAPDPGYTFRAPMLARHRLVIEAFGGWGLFQELLLALAGIAARHGITLESVALRAMHDHADIAAVVLRTSLAGQLPDRLKAFNFAPTARDREALAAVLAKKQGPYGPVFGIERENTDHRGQLTMAKLGRRKQL